jgi:hypothetical protein
MIYDNCHQNKHTINLNNKRTCIQKCSIESIFIINLIGDANIINIFYKSSRT